MSTSDKYHFARCGYDAYGESVSWKNYQGLPMPTFDALPENIRCAWMDAADGIIEEVISTLRDRFTD